jgi:hypothetical protein
MGKKKAGRASEDLFERLKAASQAEQFAFVALCYDDPGWNAVKNAIEAGIKSRHEAAVAAANKTAAYMQDFYQQERAALRPHVEKAKRFTKEEKRVRNDKLAELIAQGCSYDQAGHHAELIELNDGNPMDGGAVEAAMRRRGLSATRLRQPTVDT